MTRLARFYHNMINYLDGLNLSSVVVIIVVVHLFLMLMWKRLLRRSKREHAFGQQLLYADDAPKVVKVKLV